MKFNLAERGWIVSAVIIAAGVPVIGLAGLAFTLAVAAGVEKVGLQNAIPLFPWLWLFGLVVTSAVLWFFMRWVGRAGGWVALGAGIGGSVLVAAAAWFLGDVSQRAQPDNPMAGVGGAIFAFVIGLFALVAAFCGVIAILTDPARQLPPLDAEDE